MEIKTKKHFNEIIKSLTEEILDEEDLDLREVAKILKLRGKSMQSAIRQGEGAMAALIGPDIHEVKELIKEVQRDFVCEIANHNLQNQIVLSGDSKAIDIAISISKEKNLKAINGNMEILE